MFLIDKINISVKDKLLFWILITYCIIFRDGINILDIRIGFSEFENTFFAVFLTQHMTAISVFVKTKVVV